MPSPSKQIESPPSAAEMVDPLRAIDKVIAALELTGDSDFLWTAERLRIGMRDVSERATFRSIFQLGSSIALERRDGLIRQLAREHFKDRQGTVVAGEIVSAIDRVKSGAWRRGEPRPEGRDGLIFDLLKIGGIPAKDRIYGILRKPPRLLNPRAVDSTAAE